MEIIKIGADITEKISRKQSELQLSCKISFQKIHITSSVVDSYSNLVDYHRDIEMLDWCPTESILPYGGKVLLYSYLITLLVLVSQ